MVTGHCRHNPQAGTSDKISPDGFRLLTNPHKKKKRKKKKKREEEKGQEPCNKLKQRLDCIQARQNNQVTDH